MARTARASIGEICYHVLNRGNARHDVFTRMTTTDRMGLESRCDPADALEPRQKVECPRFPDHTENVSQVSGSCQTQMSGYCKYSKCPCEPAKIEVEMLL